jgi:hypothetical protein
MALNMRDSLAKTRFIRHVLAMLSLSFALAGCDSFSLLDMLSPLTLTAATTTVARNGDPVALNVSGGRPPYEFSVSPDHLYIETPTPSIGFVSSDTAYNSGDAIGRIEITVSDTRGEEAQVLIEVVPRTPSLVVTRQSDSDVRVAWEYFDSDFEEFQISQSTDGGLFIIIGRPNSMSGSFIDTAPRTSAYTYSIIAVAGIYRSSPYQVILPPS